jgi:hypothetical protein
LEGGFQPYVYALSNPLTWSDPAGLKVELYCHRVGGGGEDLVHRAVGAAGFSHCFVRIRCNCEAEDGPYDLRLELDGREGFDKGTISGEKGFQFGHHASIVPISPADWDSQDCQRENCIRKRFNELKETGYRYPPTGYIFGPNSNTFAAELLRSCGITRISFPPGVPPFDNWKYPLLPPIPPPSLK